MLRRLAIVVLPLIALATPGAARAASGYVNPFITASYSVGRTDMGVDLCLSPGDSIGAVGSSVVVGILPNWFEHQPYIWYRLTSGPYAGRYVYVAEQITRLARVGQTLTAGQPVAFYARRGTCIETGWATADGETLAQATTGYKEGQVTAAGVSFARFLISLGVHGDFELSAPPPAGSRDPTKKGKPRPTRGRGSGSATTAHPPSQPVPAPGTPSGGATTGPESGGAGLL